MAKNLLALQSVNVYVDRDNMRVYPMLTCGLPEINATSEALNLTIEDGRITSLYSSDSDESQSGRINVADMSTGDHDALIGTWMRYKLNPGAKKVVAAFERA